MLCEIAAERKIVTKKFSPDDDSWYYGDSYEVLDEKVQKWAGIGTSSAAFEMGDNESSMPFYEELVDLNDDYSYSFDQIADIVERYF